MYKPNFDDLAGRASEPLCEPKEIQTPGLKRVFTVFTVYFCIEKVKMSVSKLSSKDYRFDLLLVSFPL